MKARCVRYTATGGPEVIALDDCEVREPGAGEVTVEVAAAGINRADILQRRGLYPAPPGVARDIPGLEFAGRVVAKGPAADRWQLGARVMGITGGASMATAVTVHERELLPVPDGIELVDAAAIPEVFLTAWDALGQAQLRAHETLLVHAAASGVGTAALQLARVLQVRAIATSRSAAKLTALATLGLVDGDHIVATDNKFNDALRKLAPDGANVILDGVGASYFDENLRALAARGRLVMLGTLGGATATAPIAMLLGKRASVIGTTLRARPLEEKIALAQAAAAQLMPWFERGLLRPIVFAKLPMAQCADGHRILEEDRNVGKVVLHW